MADDTKLTGLPTFTPVLTDLAYGVDDPGGIPISGKLTYQSILTLFNPNISITESQISDFGTYQVQLSEGAFADGDKTKLDGIEANATADQTAAEIAAMSQDWRGAGAETLIAATAALEAASSSGISDGDKGDITVSGSGATWTIDAKAVTLAKMADMATSSLLGRNTAGAGVPEALSATTARSLLNVADGATANSTDAALLSRANHTGTQLASTISDLATVATTGAYSDLSGTPTISDAAYGVGWNGNTDAPSKNAVYDKIETLGGGGDALTTNPLSQFAATTSTQLAGVLSDEIGSGKAVFATAISGTDGTLISGTAGGTDKLAKWDANGDLVEATANDLAAPAADRIMYYDFSASGTAWLEAGSGLSITGTTLNAEVSLGANTWTGTQDFNGQQVEGMVNKVVTSVSGTLTTTAHSGNILKTSGNVTVPTTAGFNAVIIAGGAHTVSFNSTTSAAMAAGDVMTVMVESGTVIHAVLTAAADKVTFS